MSPASIESPAASAEVQPSGRSALLLRLNLAPFADVQFVWPFATTMSACHISHTPPVPGWTMIAWRSPPVALMSRCQSYSVKLPVSLGQVSIGMFGGIGYGLGSDSSG